MNEFKSPIIESFEKQVRNRSDKIAVKSRQSHLTYGCLWDYADSVARELINHDKTCANKPGHREKPVNQTVCMLFEHDIHLLVGIIAVLKAGKIYVPLDPTYPEERLTYITEDTRTRLIITNDNNWPLAQKIKAKTASHIEIINIDDIEKDNPGNVGMDISPGQIAYIMYTSGSTGNPKGVVQTHRAIFHFIDCFCNQFQVAPADKIALLTSYSHTVSVIDIFSALLKGAAVCLYDIKAEASLDKLSQWIFNLGITIYHSVPTLYRYMLDSITSKNELSRIRLVIIGGEEVLKKDVDLYKTHFSPGCYFVNLFGSSELIIATSYLLKKDIEITRAVVPIGYPVEGVEILLLNEQNEEVGIYGIGELVYKSDYLSPGYGNMPGKTDEVFVKNYHTREGRVYRSGDLGRFLPDDSIEYLGRKDSQVKIRGYRIELTEIEAVLDDMEGIKKSIVTSFKNESGENYLAAYYVTRKNPPPDWWELKKSIKLKLPHYMVPTHFIPLDEFPLTPNGKIDRKALPEPVPGKTKCKDYVPPGNETEEIIARMWQEILGLERVGIRDNFSDLGGHSLLATKLIMRLHKKFEIQLHIGDILNNPTIAEIAELLQEKKEENRKIEQILMEIEKKND